MTDNTMNLNFQEHSIKMMDKKDESMADILERLRGYNPPDRTTLEHRQISIDIYDAIAEITELREWVIAWKSVAKDLRDDLILAEQRIKEIKRILYGNL